MGTLDGSRAAVATRLWLKPTYARQILGDDQLVLVPGAGTARRLRGRLPVRLAPLLDGTRSADEIVDALGGEFPAERVYYTLLTLEQNGFVESAPAGLPPEEAAFWYGLAPDGSGAAERLRDTRVAVLSVGDTADDARALTSALGDLAVEIVDEKDAAFVVAVTRDYLDLAVSDVSRRMRAAGRAWMPFKPAGRMVWLGPVFSPRTGLCWGCLSCRIQENHPEEVVARGLGGLAFTSRAALPATRALAADLAATEVAKWAVAGRHDVLDRALLTLDLDGGLVRQHPVHAPGGCTECGTASPAAVTGAAPIVLQSRPKLFTADGGHRAQPPEDTLAQLTPFIGPIAGVVGDLFAEPSCEGLNVYAIRHAAPHDGVVRNQGRLGRRGGASGKGATDVQAKVSCLAEAIERYSCSFFGDEPRVTAAFTDLGAAAVHPHRLLNFSDRQYATRDEWNVRHPGFSFVPRRFDEGEPIEWTPAWSLTAGETRWLPTSYCFYDYRLTKEQAFCVGDSNGCASGNNLEEAILQGFLELVERDAAALWWYGRHRRPAIDLASFRDPFFDGMLRYYAARGRSLVALDLTTDLGIAAVAVVSWDARGGGILIGLGAHLDPRIAVSRAITEVSQMLPLLQSVEEALREGDAVSDERELLQWIRDKSIETEPYVVPDPARTMSAADLPSRYADDLRDDVRGCAEIARRAGLEVIVLDVTRRHVGFPVARVVVPGLRHFWARFAPGRLYDVPVALGWTTRRLDESELNPIPFFL